jgi:hypothetical protein
MREGFADFANVISTPKLAKTKAARTGEPYVNGDVRHSI